MKEQNKNSENSNKVSKFPSETAMASMYDRNPRLAGARTKLNEALSDVNLEFERAEEAAEENKEHFNRFIDGISTMEDCIDQILLNISKYDDVKLDNDLASEDEA